MFTKDIPVDNILFATEMLEAVRGIDPKTGNYYDDTKIYIDEATTLTDAAREKIFEGNVCKTYPRVNAVPDRIAKSRASTDA